MGTRKTPGSKVGRCVRLTTYHLHVPNVKKIRVLNLRDPHGPVQACSGTAFICCIPIKMVVETGLIFYVSRRLKMADQAMIPAVGWCVWLMRCGCVIGYSGDWRTAFGGSDREFCYYRTHCKHQQFRGTCRERVRALHEPWPPLVSILSFPSPSFNPHLS
jgi:hypothetical protein